MPPTGEAGQPTDANPFPFPWSRVDGGAGGGQRNVFVQPLPRKDPKLFGESLWSIEQS